MIKSIVNLAAISGVALMIANCSQENPISIKTTQENEIVAAVITPVGEVATLTDYSSGRLYAFAKASDHYVYYRYQNADGTWPANWIRLAACSAPAADNIVTLNTPAGSPRGACNWVIFKNNQNNFSCFYNQPGFRDQWTSWNSNGACFFSGQMVGVYSKITQNIHIFGRRADGNLWRYSFPTAFSGAIYEQLAGSINNNKIAVGELSSPYGVVTGNMMVFSQDPSTNNEIWALEVPLYLSQCNWWNLGGNNMSNIAVGKNQDGRLEIFGISNQIIYHKWQISYGTWSDWCQLNSVATSTTYRISVGSNAPSGRLEVFFLNSSNVVWHQWQIAANSAWDNPSTLFGSNGLTLTGNGGRIAVGRAGLASPNRKLAVFTTAISGVNYIQQATEDGAWNNWAVFSNNY